MDHANMVQIDGSVATFSPVEGVTGVALLMIAADGHVSDVEIELLNASIFRMKLFKGLSAPQIKELFAKMSHELKQRSCDDFLRMMISAIPPEMGMSVFAIAVDLAFSDGDMCEEEQAILEFMYGLLEIPRDIALQILQVMEIKNKY